MGLEVSWLPKQEVVWLLSQQNSERKTGISIQNTNQLAGNRAFIILLTLISFQRKCPESPLSGSLPLCSSALRTVPPLSDTEQHISNTSNHYSHVRIRLRGTEIRGVQCGEFSLDKCQSVTVVLKDCLLTVLTKCTKHKDWEIVTKTRREKTAGWGRRECKYTISLQISRSESQEVVK